MYEQETCCFTKWTPDLPSFNGDERRKVSQSPNGHGTFLYWLALLVPYLLLLNTGLYLSIVQKKILNSKNNPLVNPYDISIVSYIHDAVWALINLVTLLVLIFLCYLIYQQKNANPAKKQANNDKQQQKQESQPADKVEEPKQSNHIDGNNNGEDVSISMQILQHL